MTANKLIEAKSKLKDANNLLQEMVRYELEKSKRATELIAVKVLPDILNIISLLSNLQSLDLGSNQLIAIPKEISNLHNLTRLNLSNNRIEGLPEITKLSGLVSLELQDNQLVMIPKELGSLSLLKHLDLKSNRLKEIPLELHYLTQLEYFELRGNPIEFPSKNLATMDPLKPQQIVSFLGECTYVTEEWKQMKLATDEVTPIQKSVGVDLLAWIYPGHIATQTIIGKGISGEIMLGIWDHTTFVALKKHAFMGSFIAEVSLLR